MSAKTSHSDLERVVKNSSYVVIAVVVVGFIGLYMYMKRYQRKLTAHLARMAPPRGPAPARSGQCSRSMSMSMYPHEVEEGYASNKKDEAKTNDQDQDQDEADHDHDDDSEPYFSTQEPPAAPPKIRLTTDTSKPAYLGEQEHYGCAL